MIAFGRSFFTPEKHAYDIIRDVFLANKQYTHLVLLPDDLIVKPSQLRSLMRSVARYNYPVFSGVANVDQTVNKDMFAVSFDIINIERAKRRFSLMSRETLNDYAKRGKHIQVRWSGFPCMFIRRNIVERFEFNLDGIAEHDSNGFVGCCTDTVFCWNCYTNNIPIYIDPKVRMFHLKISDSLRQYFYAGTNDHPSHAYIEKKLSGKKLHLPKK